jgi:hypothetical protein
VISSMAIGTDYQKIKERADELFEEIYRRAMPEIYVSTIKTILTILFKDFEPYTDSTQTKVVTHADGQHTIKVEPGKITIDDKEITVDDLKEYGYDILECISDHKRKSFELFLKLLERISVFRGFDLTNLMVLRIAQEHDRAIIAELSKIVRPYRLAKELVS